MLTGDFVPDNFFWLHLLYPEFADWHAITGGSAVEMHVYGPSAVFEQPEANLLILAVNEIQRAFPTLKGHFIHGTIRRNTMTQTLFRVPTAESLHVETPWPGVLACGDWIGYPTPSLWMERAVVTAIAAANQVLVAHYLEPFPILSPRRPELLVSVLAVVIRLLRRALGPSTRAFVRASRRLRRRASDS
jgi:hypothetical protein